MDFIINLWLPILLSAVFVFIVSSIIHMFLPYHRNDFVKVPDEEKVMESLGKFNLPPGDYTLPCAGGPKEMSSPEYIEKLNKGPVAVMTIMENGPPKMGGNLFKWFIYIVVVSIVAAYISSRALGPGAEFKQVFRFAGATAFTGYSLALLQNSIWYKRKWSSTFKSMFDGLIYALVTAATFGWLWPAAAA